MSEAFISVGALGDGFEANSNIVGANSDLAGRTFATDLEGLPTLTIGDATASWRDAVDVPVRITSVREGIYLVGGVIGDISSTFVLDVETGLVTLVEGRLPSAETRAESPFTRVQRGDEPTGVTVTITHGRLDGSGAPVHAPTDELVGLRNRYTYSPTEAYEHIYLTPTLYTWHCLAGVERGLADTDACHHIGLRDRLTLFVWREKIVPTLGVILIDLDQLKTDGSIFGNENFDAGATVSFPVGAVAEILNSTSH